MTYGEAKATCAAKGLVMCKQSCSGKGCWYNQHPVYTDKPCPASSPSPPPPGLSASPPPSPVGLPPAASPAPAPPPPYIPVGPWASTGTVLAIGTLETADDFTQRCLRACENLKDGCDGVMVNAVSCTLHSAAGSAFFTTLSGTYIKRGGGSQQAKLGLAAKDVSTNPDWTYDFNPDDEPAGDALDMTSGTPVTPSVGAAGGVVASLGMGALIGLGVAITLGGVLVGVAGVLAVQRYCLTNKKDGAEKSVKWAPAAELSEEVSVVSTI